MVAPNLFNADFVLSQKHNRSRDMSRSAMFSRRQWKIHAFYGSVLLQVGIGELNLAACMCSNYTLTVDIILGTTVSEHYLLVTILGNYMLLLWWPNCTSTLVLYKRSPDLSINATGPAINSIFKRANIYVIPLQAVYGVSETVSVAALGITNIFLHRALIVFVQTSPKFLERTEKEQKRGSNYSHPVAYYTQ